MPNATARIWITLAVTAGWVILALRFLSKRDWPFTALSVVAALFYGYCLYRLTQPPRD